MEKVQLQAGNRLTVPKVFVKILQLTYGDVFLVSLDVENKKIIFQLGKILPVKEVS